jgi:hypothetical protein
MTFVVDVHTAHLANPLIAVSKLLASEAGAYACVEGDEHHFEVSVALADDTPETRSTAEDWVRWVVHNAGVRGEVHRL